MYELGKTSCCNKQAPHLRSLPYLNAYSFLPSPLFLVWWQLSSASIQGPRLCQSVVLYFQLTEGEKRVTGVAAFPLGQEGTHIPFLASHPHGSFEIHTGLTDRVPGQKAISW